MWIEEDALDSQTGEGGERDWNFVGVHLSSSDLPAVVSVVEEGGWGVLEFQDCQSHGSKDRYKAQNRLLAHRKRMLLSTWRRSFKVAPYGAPGVDSSMYLPYSG